MRLLIQRVSRAKVTVEDEITGEIGQGLLIFVGVGEDDSVAVSAEMAEKASRLRIFEDEQQKMNLDIMAVGGSALIVSQFTLYADTRKGNRPSFAAAAKPEAAKEIYNAFAGKMKELLGENRVAEGVFGAMMEVELINDGPVTIWVDSC
jgi:D-tyrosyl-tRNA(Tyr) deacylase